VGIVLAVALVAATSVRLYAEGPDWGLQLSSASDDRTVVAATVRGHGVAWDQHIRPGDRILSIDGLDARTFVGLDLGRAEQVVVADARGRLRTVQPPTLTEPLKVWLLGVALLFAVLGAAVQRWAADPWLGRIFLVFGGATALALASMPGALRGYALVNLLAASSATVASAAFTVVFLWFPRPVRHARWIVTGLAAVSATLLIPLAVLYARGEGEPPLLESILFIWMGGNLIAGALLLAARAVRPANRHALAPLALGVGLGIGPLALLDALPQALGHTPIMHAESASISGAAIPLAFGFAILRHRLFALDAHLRRFIVHLFAAVALVAIFVPTWLVLGNVAGDDPLATLAAVALVAFVAPWIFRRTERLVEAWLYPSFQLARSDQLTDRVASASSIAQAFAARSRELVPTRWAALLVQAGHRVGSDGRHWSMLGYDGDAPTVLLRDQQLRLAQLADQVPGATILPIEFSPTMLAAVCVGPRLDGTPLGGVDVETIQLLARAALPSTEAALLREQSEAAASFRRGLSELARELAAVGAVHDVLRVTAEHAASLVGADSAVVWLRETRGGSTYVSLDALHVTDALELGMRLDLDSLLGPELAMRLQYERIARGWPDSARPVDARDLRCVLVCWLGDWSASDTLLMLVRDNRERPFTAEDEQRVTEIGEHADGALRRAHLSAHAAEADALRELNRLRTDLMSLVAHELRGPLTAVTGYAQLLRRRAGSLTPAGIVRMADQIERSATLTNEIVGDLTTTTLHESGALAVRAENVDLGAALASIAHSFQVLPGGDRVRVEVPDGVRALADPARVEQMVGNLLFNALRYAPTGPVVVRARPASPNEVCVEVCDQGPGIPTELQPRVWDKFYRVAGSEQLTHGTGIGLAVVRTLAELHDGHVELDSAPGAGSTFRIVLPRADA